MTVAEYDTVERDEQADLVDVINRRILAHPRSAQKLIGPSEIGTPCTRKLGHKLAGTPVVNERGPAWRPTVGTAVHTWLQEAFEHENTQLGWDRWITEGAVCIGVVGNDEISGHADLYDVLTGTVIDWKIPGVTTIRDRRAARSPGQTYRAQAHSYGRGFVLAGYVVKHVAIYFLPASGEIGDGYYWTEPYDPEVAAKALQRADAIAIGGAALGWATLLPQLATANDYCAHCEWWQPEATDLVHGCPGELPLPATHTGPAFGALRP